MMMMKMFNVGVIVSFVAIGIVSGQLDTPQQVIDYMSSNLQLQYDITTNLESVNDAPRCHGNLIFTNTGDEDITTDTPWEIYFCSVRIFEPDTLRDHPDQGKELGGSNLAVYHINGCLHKISPMAEFDGFNAGETVTAAYETADWQVSRTDISPNWYVTAMDAEPRTLLSTAGESLDFVGDFTTPAQWKRQDYDEYDPYTPQVRYDLNEDVADMGDAVIPIIPTPVDWSKNSDAMVDIGSGDWLVVSSDVNTEKAAMYLAEKLQMQYVTKEPASRYIELTLGTVQDRNGDPVTNDEAYRVDIKPNNEIIEIVGNTASGLFHGANSLWSLYDHSSEMPDVTVVDYPRFPYRGMMVDVGRNFATRESILKLLDVMAMYKMNKFHFHLTDDEGWRLEIPGLEELTEIGSKRCHDLDETECIIPELGSGQGISFPGSGFYTVAEYKEILQYADDRSIEVIPEFDMPGHCHAAIKSMEARYHNLKDTNPEAADEYLLSDLEDASRYLSVQYFRDNAINPCLESTHNFVRKLIREVKAMHADIQPLKTFHFGGDEVPHGAWEQSPVCTNDSTTPPDVIMEEFVYAVAEAVHQEGLDLGGWEDGLMKNLSNAYDRARIPNAAAYAYTWNNIWEWGGGGRAYILANADYQVVLAHATDLYFDMPYEPDPEERGFYWATRFTETRDSFNYIPDSVYDNIYVDRFGRPLSKEDVCNTQGCVPLEESKRPNVVGIQGQLWSETVRSTEQFQYMVFPRILSVAERGWHKAPWEDILDDKQQRNRVRDENWEEFANTLGYKELLRLDDSGISYNVPIPGAKISDDGYLSARCNFPGLTIQYSVDEGVTWTDYKPDQQVPPDIYVHLRTRSADMSRTSRVVSLRSPNWIDDAGSSLKSRVTFTAMCFLTIAILYGFVF